MGPSSAAIATPSTEGMRGLVLDAIVLNTTKGPYRGALRQASSIHNLAAP
jgi:hypothetical protein